ncbi:unnamed protein product [Rotaria socialis]|uniref:Reverse transcriptase domain-containing protein n=8 Tax=Rotaria TaxID=231623 RepID=A0A817TI19_9BILA|nr:unnamed protein product [Rotaria socialis]CAF4515431.1 unnamed protein product [Rotaria socialis]
MYKIRNNTLQHKQKQLRYINIEINTQNSILNHYFKTSQPTRQHQDDLRWINKFNENFENKLIEKHDKKIKTLKENQVQQQSPKPQTTKTMNSKITYDTSNVINISKIHLSQEQLKVISKGLKFVPTPRSINTITTVVNCEKSLFSTPKLIKSAAISEISTFIQKWRKPTKFNMNKEETKLLKEIKSIQDIVIIQADKGGKIVIMNKNDYFNKIEEKLNDLNVYEQVKNDPTTIIKTEINKKVTKMLKQNKITDQNKYYLTSIDDLPKIRGQPKLHKIDTPMRIVTCSRDTITSPISQFIFRIIKELRTTLSGVVCNTSNFIKIITDVKLNQDEHLASLDIQDLYTNIPVNKAIDITLKRLDESKKLDNLPFTKTDIKELLILALKNSYFQFNGKFYKQKTGLPMGNTLSPILADIYMDEYQKQHLHEVNIPNKIWRYVDDILIITKMNKTQLDKYVNDLNKIRGTIKFTSEFEQNDQINYLDTMLTKTIINNETILKIRWFRKDTAADRLLNYESSHGKSIKNNIVKNMTTRILETTQDNIDQQEDLNKLRNMLLKSNYPLKEIEKLIKQTCQEFKSNKNKSNDKNDDTAGQIKDKNNDEFICSLTLPYVPGMEALKRRLEKKLKIKLFFSYPYKLQSQFNQSLKVPSKSVIYQIPCSCKETYVGQTKVGIDNRMKQHSKAINDNENNSNSEMVKHFQEKKFQCLFDTNDAFIIEEEKDYWKRRTKEAIYSIISESVNTHDEINAAWTPILHKAKHLIQRKIESARENYNKYKRTKT